jgi:hypothetical protein
MSSSKPFYGKVLRLVNSNGNTLNLRIVKQVHASDTAEIAERRVLEELLQFASRWQQTQYPGDSMHIEEGRNAPVPPIGGMRKKTNGR